MMKGRVKLRFHYPPIHQQVGILLRCGQKTNKLEPLIFQVEEFIPDRMKVSVAADKESYMLEDEVKVDVKAENLFGTPAVGRKVSGYYSLQDSRYSPPEAWNSFTFYDPKRLLFKGSFDTVNFDPAVTDIDGIATYRFTLPGRSQATIFAEWLCNGNCPRNWRTISYCIKMVHCPSLFPLCRHQTTRSRNGKTK